MTPTVHHLFSDFPLTDLPDLPADWRDVSYGNDTCPSFQPPNKSLIVYTDFADKSMREVPQASRFCVRHLDADGSFMEEPWFASDDWADVLRYVQEQSQ
jgi:hypothetical protein